MKTTFNFRKYPDVFTCEALDRQISSLRNELPLVQQKKMYGDKNRIQKFKNDKFHLTFFSTLIKILCGPQK